MIRRWMLFVGDSQQPGWWDYFTKPGFQHVCAAGCSADGYWLFFDPHRYQTTVEVYPWGPSSDMRLGQLLYAASHVLTVEARSERRIAPPIFGCVGAIKSLTGWRSRAVTPHGLYRDLVRQGAEKVETPSGRSIQAAGAAA